MVLRKRRQVIVPAAMNADKRDFMRVYFLQLLTVFNGYQPVARTMQYIRMAVYMAQPFIGTQLVHQ